MKNNFKINKTKCNIWIITIGEPVPSDYEKPRLHRSGALSQFLAKKGHQVTWFNSTFDHFKKKHRFTKDYIQNYKNLNIQFIKSTGYKKNISLMRFLDHHLLANKFERLAKNFTKPDVILCSLPTLELCSVVTKFKLQNKIPLIIDIRDLWPDIFYKVVPNFLKPIAKIIFLWQENMANYSLKTLTVL